jgi:hypothetical protein
MRSERIGPIPRISRHEAKWGRPLPVFDKFEFGISARVEMSAHRTPCVL